MLYIWMPETNGVWHWSNGENWLQAASLDQLIQDLQIHQGKEATVFFSFVTNQTCGFVARFSSFT
mgnify:CR=1 FL=1